MFQSFFVFDVVFDIAIFVLKRDIKLQLTNFVFDVTKCISCNFVIIFLRGSLYAIARPSVVCLPSVCLSSVTFVRPTQAVQIFGNISTALGTLAIR